MTPAALLAVAVAGLPVVAFEVRVPGAAPVRVGVVADEGRWRAFLDRLFDHFDRDGDDWLDAAEADRVFPLPLPDGRTVTAAAGDRATFRAHSRRAGFAPAVARVDPPSAAQRILAAALFRYLDRDADGRLSAAELRAAPDLLRRLDADEDEMLSATELLPPGFATPPPPADEPVTVGPARGRGEWVRATADPADPAAGVREARRFLLAQFRSAAGDGPGLTRDQVRGDPTLAGLLDLFAPADRDGDGRMTAAELAGFFDLLAAGVACQTIAVVSDPGRSVFAVCDADRDGRLDRHELAALAARLPAGLTAADLPRPLAVRVGRGPIGRTFGPLTLSAVPPGTTPKLPAGGPAWFRAMDRNGDGFLSPAEFLGPPAAFRRLDADGDGRISATEATVGQ